MPSLIPTSTTDANYTIQCNLDGSQYQLTFRYSEREVCFYLDLYTLSGTLLVGGRKVVPNRSLWSPFRYNRQVPQGALVCLVVNPTTAGGSDDPPGIGELAQTGTRCQLAYFNQSEIPAHA